MNGEPITAEEYAIAQRVIKRAFLGGQLPKLIGETLGKPAVLISLVDVAGRILSIGNAKPGVPNQKRNASMIRQMAGVLRDHMKEMMLAAGKEAKEMQDDA